MSILRTFNERRSHAIALEQANARLADMSAAERVAWALESLPPKHVMSSSFGAQSAAMLHLVSQQAPDIPVILIDTGYLFAETYRFIDELRQRLELNLQVYRSDLSPAWQEARYGRRWTQGLEGIEDYNHQNKVEPMERALEDLEAGTWLAGLRRNQAASRRDLPFVSGSQERWKVHPILDWSDRELYQYLQQHDLPYHPLWEEGYVSIGDVHTTQSLSAAGSAEATRFYGLKRECGLHESE